MEEEIRKMLDDHERRLKTLEGTPQSNMGRDEKPISIKEFLLSKHPKSDVQRTLAIGYYLEKYRDFKVFNASDLETGYREAKEKVPENISLPIFQNLKKGYFMEAEEKKNNLKTCTLTGTGERFVENNFIKE